MDVLLRELRDGPGGIAAYRDTEIAAHEVTIGCAADQRIQLLGRAVGAAHAVIRGKAQRVSLSCVSRKRAIVNGKEVRSARLAVGDRIEIGGHRLTVAEPPAGFDLALELRRNTSIDGSDFEAAFRTDLQQTWVGKRSAAWLLIAVTALGGFAVPFAVVKARRLGRPVPAWVPGDGMWSTGPLSAGHQQLTGERCESCHQELFAPVADGACVACHKKTGDHVATARLAQTSLGPTGRCASCHREHDEPADLVDRADKVCVACHAQAPHTFGSLNVQAVSGFGVGRHPAFASTAGFLNAGKEPAALNFSHPQHLDGDRVRKAGQRNSLGCADCHKLASDGEHFAPVTMAAHCSGCHELTFDPDAPDRQLPHGKPREVARTLQDYFVRKLSDPNVVKKPPRERRRLPGHDDEEPTCTGSTFTCAMQSASTEVETQFLRRGCVSCHQVRDTKNKDLADRFAVLPIRLARDFFPTARFPHSRHVVQGQADGELACLSCHPVGASEAPAARLPDLPTCERCHADQPTRDRTRVHCVSCHVYHPET
jgi:predicted CXXCH cytochrome family protein